MKVIKNRMCRGLLVPLVLLVSVGHAHTEAETNAVVKSMLEIMDRIDNRKEIDIMVRASPNKEIDVLARKTLHFKTTALRAAFAAAAICMAAAPLFADIAMPEVVSHRGESNDRPENTMAAFRLARASGFVLIVQ